MHPAFNVNTLQKGRLLASVIGVRYCQTFSLANVLEFVIS